VQDEVGIAGDRPGTCTGAIRNIRDQLGIVVEDRAESAMSALMLAPLALTVAPDLLTI